MPLANYTTEVSAIKSVGEIQKMLTEHGAKSILIDYKDNEPIALAFIIPTSHGDLPFRLPANIQAVERLLLKQRVKKPETWHSDYKQVMQRINEQAKRVAWRILRHWLKEQLAIIETEMVTVDQIFLPYLRQDNGKTLYEALADRHFLLTSSGTQDGEFHEV